MEIRLSLNYFLSFPIYYGFSVFYYCAEYTAAGTALKTWGQ